MLHKKCGVEQDEMTRSAWIYGYDVWSARSYSWARLDGAAVQLQTLDGDIVGLREELVSA